MSNITDKAKQILQTRILREEVKKSILYAKQTYPSPAHLDSQLNTLRITSHLFPFSIPHIKEGTLINKTPPSTHPPALTKT